MTDLLELSTDLLELSTHPSVSSLQGVRFLSSPLAKISWRKGTYLTVGLAQFLCLSCWSLGTFFMGGGGGGGGGSKASGGFLQLHYLHMIVNHILQSYVVPQ